MFTNVVREQIFTVEVTLTLYLPCLSTRKSKVAGRTFIKIVNQAFHVNVENFHKEGVYIQRGLNFGRFKSYNNVAISLHNCDLNVKKFQNMKKIV